MIRLDNVTKYYDVKGVRKYILRDVCLSIPPKINVGVLGRNGAGKSTLLRILGGIDFPNKGRIVSEKNFSWPLGLAGGVQGSLTGRQNARFICRVYAKCEAELLRTLEFVHDFSELGSYFDMPVKTYSSGMRARLGFSLSLAFDFEYYLIDETLSVGDHKFRQKCTQALEDLNKRSNFLLVSHNMQILQNMCQSGIVLQNGQLTYFEDIKDAVRTYESQV
jgi:capsular polysaccharide transport system ATP-binding protein